MQLESQLSVSKYYLNTAQQKLHKAPYVGHLQREDRELVDIRVRHRPSPVIAPLLMDADIEDRPITSIMEQSRRDPQEADTEGARGSSVAQSVIAAGFDSSHSSAMDSPIPESRKEKMARINDYESKCVPWEGFSSGTSDGSQPSPSSLAKTNMQSTSSTLEQTRLGDVYFEDGETAAGVLPQQSGPANHFGCRSSSSPTLSPILSDKLVSDGHAGFFRTP